MPKIESAATVGASASLGHQTHGSKMQKIQCLLAAALAGLMAGCGAGTPVLRGSGKIATEARKVSGFTAVSLTGIGEVIVEQTGAESLTIETDDNLLRHVTSEVRGTQLTLGIEANTSIQPSKGIIYRVTVKNLNELDVSGSGQVAAKGIRSEGLKITLSGSGTITVAGKAENLRMDEIDLSGSGSIEAKGIQADRLKTRLGGSGNITLAGKADRLEISVDGSGNCHTLDLKSKTVTIDMSGSGSALIAASEKLDATVSGSGSIEYVGEPALKQNVSGSGSIRKAVGP